MYKENVFTKILRGEIKTEILAENKYFISFKDINPQADIHILAIPKNLYINYKDFLENSTLEEKEDYHNIIKNLIEKFKLENFKILTNNGIKSGQEIFHFHIHILGY